MTFMQTLKDIINHGNQEHSPHKVASGLWYGLGKGYSPKIDELLAKSIIPHPGNLNYKCRNKETNCQLVADWEKVETWIVNQSVSMQSIRPTNSAADDSGAVLSLESPIRSPWDLFGPIKAPVLKLLWHSFSIVVLWDCIVLWDCTIISTTNDLLSRFIIL